MAATPSTANAVTAGAIQASTSAAVSAAVDAAQKAFGFSPGTFQKLQAVASIAAQASAGAVIPMLGLDPPAPEAAKPSTKAAGKQPLKPLAAPKPQAGSSSADALKGASRGATFVIQPTASYLARDEENGYLWEDVVRFGELYAAGKVTTTSLRDKDKNGRLVHRVPYGTMVSTWLKDDDVIMREAGKRGVVGKPHWLVERDQRRRICLPLPGRRSLARLWSDRIDHVIVA